MSTRTSGTIGKSRPKIYNIRRDAIKIGSTLGQRMGLFVLDHLKAVFEPA